MIQKLLKESIVVLLISNIANFLRFILQILIARLLIAEAFGIYSSAYSVVNIFSILSGVIITFITQILLQCSTDDDHRMALLIKSQRFCWYVFGLLMALSPLFSYLLSDYLHFPSICPGLFAFVTNGLILLINYYSGVLLADLRFRENAIKDLVISFLQIVLVVLLVIVSSGSYNGAMIALLVAHIGGITYLLKLTKPWNWRISSPDNKDAVFGNVFKYFPPLLGMWIVIGLFFGLDVIFARRYLSAEDAGVYAAASLIAKISFFVVSSLSNILFPTVCNNVRNGRSSGKELITLMLIVAFISCSMSLLFSVFPEFILITLFGSSYSGGVTVLVYSSWFITVFAVNTVFFNYYAAKGKIFAVVIGAVGVFASVALIVFGQPETGRDIAISFMCGSAFVLVCCAVKIVRDRVYPLILSAFQVRREEIP